jgi:quercetin dioxygenase-like cupin family protein
MRHRLIVLLILLSSFILRAQTASVVEITAEPSHHLVLQNQYVRVFKVEVPSHQSTLMHHHRHDYFYVTLGASQIDNEVAGKPPVTLSLHDGETRFTPGGFAHLVKTLSEQPFQNITVELMQDAKLRKSPPKWDEERALHILNGGTEDVLFVKDGVRASEFQLNAGGIVSKRNHAGPQLLVAVTDVVLRSEVAGRKAANIELKAGDVTWIKGGITDTLTNVGPQKANYITLEFAGGAA